MKTTWRLWFIAAVLPISTTVQAAGYYDSLVRSPNSFDQALESDSVEQVALTMTMLEPDLAEPPVAPPPPNGAAAKSTAPAPAASSTLAGAMTDCGCNT